MPLQLEPAPAEEAARIIAEKQVMGKEALFQHKTENDESLLRHNI